jgi:DNA-directed RNA polymerase subunit RPC12/RpoP
MYNEKLDNLIEMALMDGELTEKEKQVLFKNAESLGIDLDEFEMVLEAKLFEKQKNMEQEQPKATAAPKSDKFGDVKKCPACGSMIQSFQTKCIDCGHEFSNIESNVSINKLFEMLNDAENERKDEGMSVGKALGGMFANAYGLGGGDKVDSKKKTIISNFPIPTTKGDIVEFLSLAVPKAKTAGNFLTKDKPENKGHNNFVNVWKTKCEQIIMKARFSMKEDKKTLDEINNYAKELKIK